MEWLKPQTTKNMTGAHAPMKRLTPSLPARDSRTPSVTSILQSTPIMRAFSKGMVILPAATFMVKAASALLPAESQPKRAQMTATNREPMKLPR